MLRKTAKKKPGKKGGRKPRGAGKPAGQRNSPGVEADPVILASRSGIKDIVGLKRSLAVAREYSSEVVVDAEHVESIDTAALQLLAAFVLSVRQRSGTVVWKNPSAMFREMVELADLGRHLGIGSAFDSASVDDEGDDNELCPVF